MNYEKKYKDALKRAEEIIRYYKEHNRDEAAIEDLGEIFPELKESEDEKIRKELLDYCKNRADKYPNDPKYKNISAWIALLEKQGTNSVSVTKGNTSVTNAEVVSHPTVTDSDDGKCTTASTTIELKFKVGDFESENCEQKPTWSEEDEAYINDLENYFIEFESLKHKAFDVVGWLKSLKERIGG